MRQPKWGGGSRSVRSVHLASFFFPPSPDVCLSVTGVFPCGQREIYQTWTDVVSAYRRGEERYPERSLAEQLTRAMTEVKGRAAWWMKRDVCTTAQTAVLNAPWTAPWADRSNNEGDVQFPGNRGVKCVRRVKLMGRSSYEKRQTHVFAH